MTKKFIDEYSLAENRAKSKTSYFIKQIFVPITFISGGVTHHVSTEDEYCTLIDMWLHEPEDITNNLLSGLTEEEFSLLKKIATKVWLITKNMNYQAAPKTGLLRQIYQRRLINNFFPNANSILEVGPGSGYLSLLLGMDKKNVFSMDITQCFYLWQNYLYESFNLLNEFVTLEKIETKKEKINHLPWWKFIEHEKIFKKLDVITVNHALCEMGNHAVRHLLTVAHKSGYPKFFMESYGSFKYSHKRSDIEPLFREFGYKKTYDKNDVHIFEYDNKEVKFKRTNILNIIVYIPFFRTIIRYIYSEVALLKSIANLFLSKLFSGLFKKKVINKYNYDDVLKFYYELTGSKIYKTPCEEINDNVCTPKINGIKAKLAYAKFDEKS